MGLRDRGPPLSGEGKLEANSTGATLLVKGTTALARRWSSAETTRGGWAPPWMRSSDRVLFIPNWKWLVWRRVLALPDTNFVRGPQGWEIPISFLFSFDEGPW